MKKCLRLFRRTFNLTTLCLIIYFLLYIPNSIMGGYWGQPVSGNMYYGPGLRFHSLFLWQPYVGYCDGVNKSVFGTFFYPVICLDQHYVHASIDLFNSNDATLYFSKKSDIKWHPKTLAESKQKDLENALWRSRCVNDPDFCLQSTIDFHYKVDTHFLALLIKDRYDPNTLSVLRSLAEKMDSKSAKKNIERVIQDVVEIDSKRLGKAQ